MLTYTKTEAQQSRELTVIPKVATKNENPFVSSFKAFKRIQVKGDKTFRCFPVEKTPTEKPKLRAQTFHT